MHETEVKLYEHTVGNIGAFSMEMLSDTTARVTFCPFKIKRERFFTLGIIELGNPALAAAQIAGLIHKILEGQGLDA